MLPLHMQWEHSFGNTVDDMIDGLPIITKYSIVKNLYNDMFNKVNTTVIFALKLAKGHPIKADSCQLINSEHIK